MKTISKYLVAALVALLLLFVPAKRAGATGFPTIDISNLVQNMMDFVETQMREGSFFDMVSGGVTKMEDLQERWKEMQEKIEDYKMVAAQFRSWKTAYDDVIAIATLCSLFTKDMDNYSTIMYYMRASGGFLSLMSQRNFGMQMSYMFELIKKTAAEEMKQFADLRTSDPLELMGRLHDIVETLYATYAILRDEITGRIYATYRNECIRQSGMLNGQFGKLIII